MADRRDELFLREEACNARLQAAVFQIFAHAFVVATWKQHRVVPGLVDGRVGEGTSKLGAASISRYRATALGCAISEDRRKNGRSSPVTMRRSATATAPFGVAKVTVWPACRRRFHGTADSVGSKPYDGSGMRTFFMDWVEDPGVRRASTLD